MKIAGLAKSTYYDNKRQINRNDRDNWLKNKIKATYENHKGRYGYRRITITLNNDEEVIERYKVINHKRVRRLIKLLGLKAIIRVKKYSSYKGEVDKVADNILNRDFTTTKPLKN